MTERAEWEARYRADPDRWFGAPSRWVMRHALALPRDAVIVDLAAGRGRHAIPLAAAGRCVVAIDFIEGVLRRAVALEPRLRGVVADAHALPLRRASADAVLCVSFLDRALFPHLIGLLRPGGTLIFEAYTVLQLGLGRGPRDPAHLLEPAELPRLVSPLRVVDAFEGLVRDDAGERYAAGVAAVNG